MIAWRRRGDEGGEKREWGNDESESERERERGLAWRWVEHGSNRGQWWAAHHRLYCIVVTSQCGSASPADTNAHSTLTQRILPSFLPCPATATTPLSSTITTTVTSPHHPLVTMDGQQPRQWGITAPISAAQPSPADLKLNDQLVDELKRQNIFESTEGSDTRLKVLQHLQAVVDEFIRRVGKAKGLPQSTIDSAGGKIFCFGSYALGVHGPCIFLPSLAFLRQSALCWLPLASDIDTLVVAPKHVFLDDFFDRFPAVFKEMSAAEDITEFNPVREAYVPIIKMEYRGVSIDLIFASLPTMSQIPKDLEGVDKTMLRGLDDTTMRSVNGTRVTLELLQSVPQIKSFRHALRAVKFWANQRAIYGAVFGYPGGIAWAIMVARICQLYPYACGATVLTKFFRLIGKWPFPRPVMLKEIEEGTLNLRVWNPTVWV
jgi:poly(A) polymerase